MTVSEESAAFLNHPPARPWKLWAVCVVVVAALLVAWAGDRAKPLVLFPLILGAVFGGIASLAGVWCELPRRRFAVVLMLVGAVVLVPASYFAAAKRRIGAEKVTNPLAEKLLKQIDQQSPEPTPSLSFDNVMKTYLQRRYRRGDVTSNGLCLLGESALAGIAAGAMILLVWRGRKQEIQG